MSFAGNTAHLTQRECKFLELLLTHPVQAFSRDQIFDHCWHRDFLPNSRSLDQFVLTLRQKLESQLQLPRFITTVYGRGYRIDTSPLRYSA